MSITYKALSKDDYLVEPYVAKATQVYYVISGSADNDNRVTIDLAEQPPLLWPSEDEGAVGFTNDSGRHSYYIWKSLLQTVYWPSASMSEVYLYYPSGAVYVVSMASEATGDGIYPGSFEYSIVGINETVLDDRYGNLYLASSPATVLGTIDYTQGLAVIKKKLGTGTPAIDANGVYFNTSVTSSVEFKSTTTIYQHTAYCKMTPAEFNFTLNPTAQVTVSEYDSGSGQLVTGSLVYDMFDTGSLTPYFTSIGLYDQNFNLVAVAKIANPIPRSAFSDQMVVVKFDT
jgi:hypothetical protein